MKPREITIFLLLLFTAAYFIHRRPGWNVNTRMALTFALVEKGTVRIDDYWNRRGLETQDVAKFGGHYYCDKVIGTSLLGVPAFALVRGVEVVTGRTFSIPIRQYVTTLLSVSICYALAGVLLYRLLRRIAFKLTGSRCDAGAVTGTLLTMLGTQLVLYSGLFMAYAPAVMFMLMSMLLYEKPSDSHAINEESNTNSPASPSLFLAGLCMGLGMLCDYLVGMAWVLFGVYIFVTMPRRYMILKYVAGGVLGMIPFWIYAYSIFGMLAIPYEFEAFPLFKEFMARGLMGATEPRPFVLWLTTFHPFRGIFIHSPFLLAAVVGFWMMRKEAKHRMLALLVIAVACSYLLFNSAYFMWWGGWSFGPRHVIPALPFLAMPVGLAWHNNTIVRFLISMLGSIAVVTHLVVNSVEPQYPDRNYDPEVKQAMPPLSWLLYPEPDHSYEWVFRNHVLPRFIKGEVEPSIGTLVGLKGQLSILPLVGVWGIGLVMLYRKTARRQEFSEANGSSLTTV